MAAPNVPFLRTPSSRFTNLPEFPYVPKYVDYGNLRMAYIDETSQSLEPGNTPIETFLCLHGQPTWSYLYRKMIPILLTHTTRSSPHPPRRAIAPDLLGFGRSDKPTRDADYTYTFHRNSLIHLITALDLHNITLVVQDWGGLLGLTLPLAFPNRIKRLLVMNTTIATGMPAGKGFNEWRAFSNRTPDMKVGELMHRSCRHLTQAEVNAYDAPFTGIESKAGVRRFPQLVMTSPDMDGVEVSKEALKFYAESDEFKTPDVFMACGMRDPVLGPHVMKTIAKMWKNGCYYMDVSEGGHFVQEWGLEVAKMAIEVFEKGKTVGGINKVDLIKANL